ncbi:MAG: hypothetical protein ACRDOL_43075, partial [Streptosporangiaceae bacterium]
MRCTEQGDLNRKGGLPRRRPGIPLPVRTMREAIAAENASERTAPRDEAVIPLAGGKGRSTRTPFDTFTTMGLGLVTADEFGDPGDERVRYR